MTTLPVNPVDDVVKDELRDFQKMLHIIFDAHDGKMNDTRDYKKLKIALRPFQRYSWYKLVASVIDRQNKTLTQNKTHERIRRKITPQHIREVNTRAVEIFKSMDVDAIINKAGPMLNKYMPAFERQADSRFDFENVIRNPVQKSGMLFGSGADFDLVSVFTKQEADKVIDLNMDDDWFSYMDYPHDTADLYSVIYYMQCLQSEDTPKEIDGKTAMSYIQMSSSKDEAIEFIEHMKKYLRSNNNESLAFILDKINTMPLLKKLNDDAKQSVAGTELYRGVGLDEDDEVSYDDEVKEIELNKSTVAVTRQQYVAVNFANKRGHLDGNRSNSDYAYVITYVPEVDDIVVVMDIFGSAYGESEIIIKPTESNFKDIVDVKQYASDDYDDGFEDEDW